MFSTPLFSWAPSGGNVLALKQKMRSKSCPRSLFLAPFALQNLIDGRLQVIVTDPPWYSSQIGETPEVTFKQRFLSFHGQGTDKILARIIQAQTAQMHLARIMHEKGLK